MSRTSYAPCRPPPGSPITTAARPRVAIDVQPLAGKGGIATYAKALVGELSHDPDISPLFCALRGAGAARRALPPELAARLIVPAWPSRLAERLWRFCGQALPFPAAVEADLVHGTHFLPPLTPLPAVITVHDLVAFRQPELVAPEVRRQARLWPAAALGARRVIAPSGATAADVERYLGVPPERIRIVPLAPTPLPPPGPSSRVAGVMAGGPFVLFVGALEPRKNLPRLIAAFRDCREAAGHRLVLAGPAGRAAGARLAAGGAGERLVIMGEVSDGDLAALYAGAACFAFPSLFEGFGLPPLDAMAAGVPVVAGDRGSLPEVLGDAALLVDPGDTRALRDAMGRILGEPALARELGERGRERAARYSWRRTAELTREVYGEAVGCQA